MNRIFAIGDIHGCSNTFKALVQLLNLQPADHLYCVGDYIDRGPDSKGVIDYILQLRTGGYNVYPLRGNHEQMMMDSIISPQKFEHWVNNGGEATLKSFGCVNYTQMEPVYQNFFSSTKHYYEHDNFIFAHAGLNFARENIFEDVYSMLWIRNFVIDAQKLGQRLLIHGHTPVNHSIIRAQPIAPGHALNIDAGCVYAHNPGQGRLVALNLTEQLFVSVANCG